MGNMKTAHAPHFFLRTRAASPKEEKVAVIVSGSTYKKAVDRNLLRRRMYHLLRKHKKTTAGLALTVTFKKGALKSTFEELEQEFLGVAKGLTPSRR